MTTRSLFIAKRQRCNSGWSDGCLQMYLETWSFSRRMLGAMAAPHATCCATKPPTVFCERGVYICIRAAPWNALRYVSDDKFVCKFLADACSCRHTWCSTRVSSLL